MLDVEAVEDGSHELGRVEPRGAQLQKEQVGVDHRVGKVALDVRHRLPADLQTVSYPHPLHYLVECNLKYVLGHSFTQPLFGKFFHLLNNFLENRKAFFIYYFFHFLPLFSPLNIYWVITSLNHFLPFGISFTYSNHFLENMQATFSQFFFLYLFFPPLNICILGHSLTQPLLAFIN